jgi:hypothetical protein
MFRLARSFCLRVSWGGCSFGAEWLGLSQRQMSIVATSLILKGSMRRAAQSAIAIIILAISNPDRLSRSPELRRPEQYLAGVPVPALRIPGPA